MTNDDSTYYLTLLRHAESTGNAENRMQGQSDYPLSSKGRAQAGALAGRWQAEGLAFDWAIASPLLRASETAEIITKALNTPLEFDPIWMERHNGKISGLLEHEARALYPDQGFINPYQPLAETGEGDWQLYLRAGQALHNLLQRPPGRYLVVSHGGTLNMTLYAIMGISPQPNYQGPRFRFLNTSFSQFRYYPAKHRWRVDVIGDRVHWKDGDE
jgi:broad specificity phosphatase PhoE